MDILCVTAMHKGTFFNLLYILLTVKNAYFYILYAKPCSSQYLAVK